MTGSSNDEPFLSRWARRKQDARSGDKAETADVQPTPVQTDATAPDAGAPADAEFDLSQLPKIEELTVETDIAAFLDKRVPAVLRNAALSRMWTLDPTIRDFIEVAENQWNWNVPGGAPFYELMEPGTGASTLLADATSAIVRPLGTPSDDGQPGADAISKTEKAAIDSGDLQSTQNIAPPSNETQGTNELAAETPGTFRGSPPDTLDVASQQIDAHDDFPVRRRHGGALPS